MSTTGISKKVAILGSTGSIGCNTLRVIEFLGEPYSVVALSAGNSIDTLVKQIAQFRPQLVSVSTAIAANELKQKLADARISPIPEICFGAEGLVKVATHPDAGIVVSATVGSLGFVPTYRALELGRRVALANKETLVM